MRNLHVTKDFSLTVMHGIEKMNLARCIKCFQGEHENQKVNDVVFDFRDI